ncbi:MAG: hypothetical protein ACPLKQ_05020 [Candidatus Bathyarchaeales archaeon]
MKNECINTHVSTNKFCDSRSTKIELVPTMNQLKLAIALELKAEGYSAIIFDKVIETKKGKVRVHVFGEDTLGVLAVVCINRLEQLNLSSLVDSVEGIQQVLGEDGDVAIAMPMHLINKADDIFGITGKVYLVDNAFRVWTHLCDNAYTKMIKHVILSQQQLTLSEKNGENLQIKLQHGCQSVKYVI